MKLKLFAIKFNGSGGCRTSKISKTELLVEIVCIQSLKAVK